MTTDREVNPYVVQGMVIKCSDELLDIGVEPLEIAAAHISHALKIYRTILSQSEYDELVESVYRTRNKVDPIEPIRMH
jgi:hypothetical protein